MGVKPSSLDSELLVTGVASGKTRGKQQDDKQQDGTQLSGTEQGETCQSGATGSGDAPPTAGGDSKSVRAAGQRRAATSKENFAHAAAPNLQEMLTVVDPGARTSKNIFLGPAMPTPHGRSFGGQVLGQAVCAAGKTVAAGRFIHSLHGYFLRPGVSVSGMTFEVRALFDGGSVSTREVRAYQGGEVLMSLTASFQSPRIGLDHQEKVDVGSLPSPESLPSLSERYGHLADSVRGRWLLGRPFDFRYVDKDIVLSVDEVKNSQLVWVRARQRLGDDALTHAAAIAFGCDYLILEPVLRRHGVAWATPGIRSVSLDHAMWFHRPFRADEWLLYELCSPTAQAGRGLSFGRFYDGCGDLVASVAQETMIKLPVADV